MEDFLKRLYYDLNRESGLGCIKKLHRAAKEQNKYKITRTQIKEFFKGTECLHAA